jgi:hypothetical protein
MSKILVIPYEVDINHIKYTISIVNIAKKPVKVERRNILNIKVWKIPPIHF